MNDYIKSMRKLIGHIPLILCGASTIVINDKNEILLQKRMDNNMWGYAGGAVEIMEKVEDAAKRELVEETGLVAHGLELFGVFSGEGSYYVYPNGDEVSVIDVVYLCREYSGELIPQEDEVKELKFFSIHDLPKEISPPCIEPINKFVELSKNRG